MDVAPWDKHWIKRELDDFGLYSMVFVEFNGIQWYLQGINGIHRDSMVFREIQWYSQRFNGIPRDSMVFNGIRRDSLVLNGIRRDSMVFIEI